MTVATMADITEVEAVERPAAHPPAIQQARSVAASSATPADLVRYAIESGADLDRLERLMDMQIKWEANEARKAFAESMAEFKLNAPVILKDKYVSFETGKGTTAYSHATIGNVVEKVVAGLANHGFSHRWVPGRKEGGVLTITCVITHKLGHSEETTLEGGADASGGKNNIQAMSSTNTYLERYSLLAAVGLAPKDQPDDDGRSAEEDANLVEDWIGKARLALTVEALESTWALGVAEISKAGDRNAYNLFKAEVTARKTDLNRKATTGEQM